MKRNQHSSHGSSGIGSDLAPSPERHEEEISTSSSGKLSLFDEKLRETFDPHSFADDWKNEGREVAPTNFIRKVEKIQISPSFEEKLSPTRYRDNPPSYIFPKEPSRDYKGMQKFKEVNEKPYRPREDDHLVKKPLKDNYIHESKKHYAEQVKPKGHVEDDRRMGAGLMRQQSERYRHSVDQKYSQSYDNYERENLTDRQKYREIIKSEKYQKHEPVMRGAEVHRSKRDFSPEQVRTLQRKAKDRYDGHDDPRSKHKIADDYVERNPYREPESLPYRESIENMMKSPVMKYKSRIPYDRSPPREMYAPDVQRKQVSRSYSNQDRDLYIKDSSPMSTMKKTSPKDRFQDAKEKFQAMEKIRLQKEAKPAAVVVRRSEAPRYEKEYRPSYSPEPRYHAQNDWSSEEEFAPKARDYRDMHNHQRHQQQQRFMGPAKSLGNLAKGYRHSYAEPIKYCIGRVGLAAIEPY